MTGRISRLAALAATLTVTLVCALPSAHAAAPPTPITGFADVHVHQFANLGFGGLVVWGQSFTPGQLDRDGAALGRLDARSLRRRRRQERQPRGDDVVPEPALPEQVRQAFGGARTPTARRARACDIFNPCDGFAVHGAGGLGDLVNAFSNGSLGHRVGGYPEFDGWPRYDNVTSQAVYYDWLQRAYKGGLRLMVMLAVNNEVLCKAGSAHPRVRLRRHACRRPATPGRTRPGGVRRRAVRRSRAGLVSHRDHAAAGAPGDRRRQARRRARDRGRHALRLQQALDVHHHVHQPAARPLQGARRARTSSPCI